MNEEARQSSRVIESVARAVANWTVDQHAEAGSRLAERYGVDWRSDWFGHTLAQIQILAQAVAVRSSGLFASSVRWTSASFQQRGVGKTDLRQNLLCLRDVLSRELPPTVADIVASYIDDSLARLDQADTGSEPGQHEGLREVALQYLQAILEGERSAAETYVLEKIGDGMSIPDVYARILAPAQARLGQLWHDGEISVADEHFGSATTHDLMAQLRPNFKRAAPNGRTVIATSTSGDLHDIGLRMVADLFEIDGWRVVYLGANTPIDDVLEMMARRRADLLALSVSTALSLRDAGELIEAVRAAPDLANVKVLIGGPPFRMDPDMWRELGADGCAQTASEAVELGNQVVVG